MSPVGSSALSITREQNNKDIIISSSSGSSGSSSSRRLKEQTLCLPLENVFSRFLYAKSNIVWYTKKLSKN